jgi:hypothetical protein
MKWIKRYAVNICLAAFSILLVLSMMEVMLRLIDYKKHLGARQMKDYFLSDNISGFDIAENCPLRRVHHEGNYYYTIWSNELGCLDKPYAGEKDYVLLVGDSFTHHFGAFENKWGTLFENFIGMRVLKCGVAGYGTKQELIKAEKVISKVKTPPRLIVIGYFMNDFDDDYRFPPFTVVDGFLVEKRKIVDYRRGTIEERDTAYLERQARKYARKAVCSKYDECSACSSFLKKVKCWVTESSMVAQKIESMASIVKSWMRDLKGKFSKKDIKKLPLELDMLAFYPLNDFPWLNKAWETHFENLRSFKNLADKYNSKLLVVIIPAKEQVYPYTVKDKRIDLEQPNKFLRGFFQKEKIHYIDLLDPFRQYADKKPKKWMNPEKDLYMRLDKHWSKKGEMLTGLLVSQFIIENRLTVSPDSSERLKSIKEKLNNF